MQAVIRNRDRMVIDVISVFASNADESFLWLEIFYLYLFIKYIFILTIYLT
jgi:hypothetical protein